MVREPVASGSFYSNNPSELKEVIRSCFMHELGPGKESSPDVNPRIIIVPHAGYFYSGACAAHAYSLINEKPDVVVILGPNHSGLGSSTAIMVKTPWKTPLGNVSINTDFAKAMALTDDALAHSQEHSIEVQLPFLQYKLDGFSFVPISLATNSFSELEVVSDAVLNAELETGMKALIVCSSDFTHYGPAYEFTPFSEDVKKNLYALDKKAVDLALHKKARDFFEFATNKTTICGFAPITAGLMIAKGKGRLLKYYTSGDISGDYTNAVGYASIAFNK